MFYKRHLIGFQIWKVFCFLIVVAALCQICSAVFPTPTKVIGIYKHEKSASIVAYSLAVEMCNKSNKRASNFSYESVQADAISGLTDAEMIEKLNNSVIVTGESSICERLSTILYNLSSFLVCHGTATTEAFEELKFKSKLILSRPNPKALDHALFKLFELVIENQKITPEAYFVFDRNHPYSKVGMSLQFSLRNSLQLKKKFDEIILPSDHEADWLVNEDFIKTASVINAILHENEARDLLCHIFYNSQSIENLNLILVGLSKDWIRSMDNLESSYNTSSLVCNTGNIIKPKEQIKCNSNQLRYVAEGHFLLEYPSQPWISSDNEKENITRFRELLREKLHTANLIEDYDEAPLAFDTAWGILKAINTASSKRNGLVSGKLVGQELIDKPFLGFSGKFSFSRYQNENNGTVYVRNFSDATITIYRYENGSYIPIGQHFNANSTFHWFHKLFLDNNRSPTWKSNCANEPMQSKSCGRIIPMSVLALLLTLSLAIC